MRLTRSASHSRSRSASAKAWGLAPHLAIRLMKFHFLESPRRMHISGFDLPEIPSGGAQTRADGDSPVADQAVLATARASRTEP